MHHADMHLIWLWLWYVVGAFVYMLKRAYYLVTGPNPVANSYKEFWVKCWIPLLVRFVVDSGIFWLAFYPDIFNAVIAKIGFGFQLHSPMSEMPAPVALFVGLAIDSIIDFSVTKIPYVKDWLPQMPAPLKPVVQTPPPPSSNGGE